MSGAAITRVHSICPVGFDAPSCAAAIRADISALEISDDYLDANGEPIKFAELPIIGDLTDDEDLVDRIAAAAIYGVDQVLAEKFEPGA